ncbi:hypothetical protein GCM10010435_47750 [Winogradskya consettensis]|uniref:ABC transporter n=1 Tax=Winogradskya consettensis TaxID=113560 RepID=A0A919SLL0_9ACTN|nr:hypothetical protein [Actinoplanes consettensis]GIM72933.1 hypothetical protein Aco04nite_32680 [Actinoplanes consettensis]
MLTGIDLSVAAAEVIAVLGPSACGKSTLPRMAGGPQPTGEPGATLLGFAGWRLLAAGAHLMNQMRPEN